jgi:hypothetical protein
MIKIETGVISSQAKNTSLYIQIGYLAIFIGKGKRFQHRLELFRPCRNEWYSWFMWA